MKKLPDAGSDAWDVPLFKSGDEGDVLRDGEMRKKAGLLNNVSNSAAEADGIGIGGGMPFDEDLALCRDEHAVYQFEKSGFAAATAAQQDESLAARNTE